MEIKRRIGSYVCWGCHQEFPLYEGQRRRYCPACALARQKALAGSRPKHQAEIMSKALRQAMENEFSPDSLHDR